MRHDLTSRFIEAQKTSKVWKEYKFQEIMADLKDNPEFTIVWDSSVPERWVGVNKVNKAIAVIDTESPLVILLEQAEKIIRDTIQVSNVIFATVPDFEKTTYKLDENLRKELFPHKWSDIIDPKSFTIRELVYGTI